MKERERLNPEDSRSCLRTLKLTDTREAAQAAQRLRRMEKRQSHIMTNAESESERSLIVRTLTGKAWMDAYRDRIAETQRVKERKRARVERGARDVPMEPRNRADEQVAVRHADASGGDIRENQHEEDRRRDNHVGKRGSEAAGEEQPDKLRKTVRLEQEAPSAAASSDPTASLEYTGSGETQDRSGSVLVQKSGHVDHDLQISAPDPFYEMDGRKSRYTGEVLDWYPGEDAGDFKRSE